MIRRYAQPKPSRGTQIPWQMRVRVIERDGGCAGFGRFPVECSGPLELDHVRASHGMGMKSETTDANLVALCGNCHKYKTAYGRQARPILLDYLAQFEGECGHVDPNPSCSGPCQGTLVKNLGAYGEVWE